jgi:hypothetical protein
VLAYGAEEVLVFTRLAGLKLLLRKQRSTKVTPSKQQTACRTAHLGAAASTASGVASSRPRPAAAFLGAGLGAALLAGRLGVVGLVAAGLVVVAGLVGVCSGFFTA